MEWGNIMKKLRLAGHDPNNETISFPFFHACLVQIPKSNIIQLLPTCLKVGTKCYLF